MQDVNCWNGYRVYVSLHFMGVLSEKNPLNNDSIITNHIYIYDYWMNKRMAAMIFVDA